jgi:hypothetical protein
MRAAAVCSKARRDVNAPGWLGSGFRAVSSAEGGSDEPCSQYCSRAGSRSASTARRLNPIAWAGTAARGAIAWICELAAIEREAATADALAQR